MSVHERHDIKTRPQAEVGFFGVELERAQVVFPTSSDVVEVEPLLLGGIYGLGIKDVPGSFYPLGLEVAGAAPADGYIEPASSVECVPSESTSDPVIIVHPPVESAAPQLGENVYPPVTVLQLIYDGLRVEMLSSKRDQTEDQ